MWLWRNWCLQRVRMGRLIGPTPRLRPTFQPHPTRPRTILGQLWVRPIGAEDADEAPPPNRFQATTTFNPGSSFPAGNQVSHMRVLDNRVDEVDHGTWRQQDRADSGEHTQS